MVGFARRFVIRRNAAVWKIGSLNHMTREELEQLLQGDDLSKTLDIKTLVLDLMRELPDEEIHKIFWDKLDQLSLDFVRDYLYMRRG